MSITRRDFLRLSGGAAAGAVLAGLGLSVNPRKAHAITGVEEALLGAGVLGLAGLLGVSLGYKTYNDIENGTADAVGRSFGAYLSDAANEGAIVASAGADAATVVGAGYSEAQLKESYARGAFADGLAQSITSTTAGALDWLNARTQDAALAWGALKAYFATLDGSFDKYFIGSSYVAYAPPTTAVRSWVSALGADAVPVDAYNPPFVPASVILYRYFSNNSYKYYCNLFEKPLYYVEDRYNRPSGVDNYVYPYRGGLAYSANYSSVYFFDPTYSSNWTLISSGRSASLPLGADDSGYDQLLVSGLANVSMTVINPSMDRAVDSPQSIDPASWGFGVPVIGTDAVINGDTLQNSGHLLAPGTVGELTSDGTLSLPWSDIVWGAGLGLGDASVRGIEGDASLPLGVPIPADIPVTVSVPVSDTAYGEKTMTLEDALSSGIDTSISRSTDIPITPEGTPFYPVPVPGSDVSIPSGLPFSGLHWETVFPFNMIYSLTDWVSKNL